MRQFESYSLKLPNFHSLSLFDLSIREYMASITSMCMFYLLHTVFILLLKKKNSLLMSYEGYVYFSYFDLQW